MLVLNPNLRVMAVDGSFKLSGALWLHLFNESSLLKRWLRFSNFKLWFVSVTRGLCFFGNFMVKPYDRDLASFVV